MLSPYRVLDLTDEGALFCGQILGDLGADVILVEPPRGARWEQEPQLLGAQPKQAQHHDRPRDTGRKGEPARAGKGG